MPFSHPADDAGSAADESLPALQRRILAPLFVLVVVLVGLAAGDSIYALWEARAVSRAIGGIAWTDLGVQAGVRAIARTQLERHAALGAALGARDDRPLGEEEARVSAVARFAETGTRLERETREARERLDRAGWSGEDLERTRAALESFQRESQAFDRAAAEQFARMQFGCDAACARAATALDRQASALDMHAFAIGEVASFALDRSAELVRAGENGALRRSLIVSAMAFLLGVAITAIVLRRIVSTLRRGIERRETAVDALRRSDARTRAILEASIDPIVTIGADGLIRSASPAFTRVFGWEPAELVGRNVSLLMPEPQRSMHDGYLARMGTPGSTSILGSLREVEAVRRDGTAFPCEVWVDAVEVPEGEEPLYCGVLRDITERKQAERRQQQYASHLEVANLELADSSKVLQDVVAQLHRSNEDLDEFAHVASHDLKEPLRGIHHQSRFLLEDHGDRLDAEGRARLETLSTLALRLGAMIDALLEFSRLGRKELGMTRTDLQEVVDGVLQSLSVVMQERKVDVRIPRRLPTVYCSAALVAEVFRNLIENAIRYNDRVERVVEISFQDRDASGAERRVPIFAVRDDGIGIEEQHFESIFRILKRIHARDRYGGGTGMGLTLVKKIVERHGGRIWLESKPGEGSTFFFTLARES